VIEVIKLTVHELKTFFDSVRTKHFRYRAALRKEYEMRGSTEGANTKHFSGLPPSEHKGNGTENKYLRLLSYSEKTKKEKQQLEKARSEALDYINLLDDPAEFRVMDYRYIKFLKWDDISRYTHYSERQVRRIHNSALKHIAEKMSDSDT